MHARFLLTGVALAITVACGSGGVGQSTVGTSAAPGGECSLPPDDYSDLEACNGVAEQIELEVADSFEGKTLARVAIPSKDAQEILAAMGAYTVEWSTGADSFTVFAYASGDDYYGGATYNRGRIFWNNGGPITLDICTDWIDLGDGIESCFEESHYTLTNR